MNLPSGTQNRLAKGTGKEDKGCIGESLESPQYDTEGAKLEAWAIDHKSGKTDSAQTRLAGRI